MNEDRWTGAHAVARLLAQRGRVVHTVSGNQILPLIDALPDFGVRIIHLRHETAAVYAAIGEAEVTGRITVALVSAGPGFLAALQGVGVARSMELPLLFLSGAAPVSGRDGAFQHLDQQAIATTLCKASLEPRTVNELHPRVLEALAIAESGVPGPVHLALPADLLAAPFDATQRPLDPVFPPAWPPFDVKLTNRLDEMAALLAKANRPAVVARPSAARSEWLATLGERLGVQPLVIEAPRGLSDLKYAEILPHLQESDCLLAVAPADFAIGWLGEAAIGNPRDVLLVDAPGDPRPRRVDQLHVRCGAPAALRYLAGRLRDRRPVDPAWSELFLPGPPPQPTEEETGDGPHPLTIAAIVREHLAPGDIVVLDGGEFAQWVRLGLRDISNRVLWNGKLGAIGGALPMGLGALASGHQGRVIVIAGDGGAGYHLSELETAAREGLRVVMLIGNDARWGAEWHMQVARYGHERAFATSLSFARYDVAASGFGVLGAHAGTSSALRGALEIALTSGRPACINVRVLSERSPAVVH